MTGFEPPTTGATGLEPELVRAAAAPGALRATILDLWQRLRIDWSLAGEGLSAMLRERRLGSRERRFVAEVLYGLMRNLRRVDEGLAGAGLSGGTRARDELRLIAFLVLEGGLSPADASAVSSAVDWSAVAAVDQRLAAVADPARRLAGRWSLPDWLAGRLVADLGDAAEPLVEALSQRGPAAIRVNPLVQSPDELIAKLAADGVSAAPGRLASTALVVAAPTDLHRLDSFRAGGFEPMDEGSQLIAELVAPPARGLVVDFCAGAGGKSLAMAAAMGNRGRVFAADVDGRKLGRLRKRAKRAGVTTIHSVAMDPEGDLPAALARIAGRAQRVLVDAPCSGLGALRRHPETRWRLAEVDLDELPRRQLRIAERALPLVAPGGWLVYATCTVLRAENQEVVAALLARHRDLSPVPVADILGPERAAEVADPSGRFLLLQPHRHGSDGFFAVVLERAGS